MKNIKQIEYYDNGLIKYKINYIDGNGEYISYHHSGLISCKSNFIDGKLKRIYKSKSKVIGVSYILNKINDNYFSGLECNYYNTDKKPKLFVISGKLHGESIGYYENGKLYYKSYYINGDYVSELNWISYNRNLKLDLLGL